MKNTTKFSSTIQFCASTFFLFLAFTTYNSAITFERLELNYITDVSGMPLAIILSLLFVLGGWLESGIEKIVASKGRRTAFFALLGIFVVILSIMFSASLFTSRSFLLDAIQSSGCILTSGFFFRLAARPDVTAELQKVFD